MSYRYLWDHGDFREGTAYRKNREHSPKVKSERELQKEAWRQHKGFNLDKAKRNQFRIAYKQFHIQYDHRRHRRYSKRMVAREHYDRMYNRDWIEFNDPWHWD